MLVTVEKVINGKRTLVRVTEEEAAEHEVEHKKRTAKNKAKVVKGA